MSAEILDCTLRDGAYLIDKKFSGNMVHGIIEGLAKARIDIIEIGFLQDKAGEGETTVFFNSREACRYVPKNRANTMFTVLADYSRYSVSNLDNYSGKSFDAVRACFFRKERKDVLSFAREIINKGYKLFIQPVDILSYSDMELLDLLSDINSLEPYCFSIVDTYGSMYMDDIRRIFSIIDHNLIHTAKVGFHSHNNLQLSSALSQEFISIAANKRNVIVDTTILGMGRGAGNTPTELIVQYMNAKLNSGYNLDIILDLIDQYMDSIKSRCSWGYDIPMFITGCYSAHVNNVMYLKKKNSIRSKDIRFILNSMDANKRKKYDYDLLETSYLEYMKTDIDDNAALAALKERVKDRKVLILAPGNSINLQREKIFDYIRENSPIVILIGFIIGSITADYVYFSNVRRYDYWKNDVAFNDYPKILTSNVCQEGKENELIISFHRLVKSGWDNIDNSTIMLLRLLDMLEVKAIGIGGVDGFSISTDKSSNYVSADLEAEGTVQDCLYKNMEIEKMLKDFMKTKRVSKISFVTSSRFEKIIGD